METFRVRLNCIDHYQSQPTDLDPALFVSNGPSQSKSGPLVPVIRVFGSTETGQKVCAHVHGILPYLYVQYRGSLSSDIVTTYIQNLRTSIDHALAVSYRRNTYNGKSTYVAHISLVKGVPFFGYHVGHHYFLKIYLLNPMNMTRFADLLHQGAVMGTVFQPFEAHTEYLQQWMCDYNLFGCSYMDCKEVRFRDPIPTFEGAMASQHRWHEGTVDNRLILDPERYARLSHCSVEIDIQAQYILNRLDIQPRDQHSNFLERLQAHDPVDKFVHSLTGLWRDETKRRRRRLGITDPSSSPFPPEVLVSMSADNRDVSEHGWIHEREFREKIRDIIHIEQQEAHAPTPAFDEFISADPLGTAIKTAFDSVEDLFPDKLSTERSFVLDDGSGVELPATKDDDDQEVAAKNSEIPSFHSNDFPYESDEDIAREIALSQNAHQTMPPSVPSTPQRPKFLPTSSPSTRKGHPSRGTTPAKDRIQRQDEVSKRESWRASRYAGQEADFPIPSPSRSMNWRSLSPAVPTAPVIAAASPIEKGRESRLSSPDRNSVKRRKLIHMSGDDLVDRASVLQDIGPEPTRPRSRHVTFGDGLPDESHLNDVMSAQSRTNNQSQSKPVNGCSASPSKEAASGTEPLSPGPSSVSSNQRQAEPDARRNQKSASSVSSLSTKLSSVSKSYEQVSRSASESASSASGKFLAHDGLRLEAKAASSIVESFPNFVPSKAIVLTSAAPLQDQLLWMRVSDQLPSAVYQDAYYSNEVDVPERARDYAGREFWLESKTLPFLPPFDSTGLSLSRLGGKDTIQSDLTRLGTHMARRESACSLRNWQICASPPSNSEVCQWVQHNPVKAPSARRNGLRLRTPTASQSKVNTKLLSQIDGPTQKHKHGSKYGPKQQSTSVRHETQYMSTMSLEIHVNTRDSFVPNPEQDEVACIFWCLRSDEAEHQSLGTASSVPGSRIGIMALASDDSMVESVLDDLGVEVHRETDELDLINHLVDMVRDFDPDIITGYEVHNSSWGYLIERARIKYEYNLCDELSRMKSQSHGRFGKDADRWGFQTTSTVRVTGRHTINIWRAMRSEVNLLQYTMENLVFHLLQRRVPHFTFRDLTAWYKSPKPSDRAKTLQYFLTRVQLDLELLDANELIPRTSEQARLIGVDFFSVFSRGSQFKVESFMFRIAKPESFILVSPSKNQVGRQNALECLPLVMEPQSAFYNSPLLVLDFQSLYPSIMIAYNYCYSTCLGRVVKWRGDNKMGFADFKRQPRLLELVKDHVNVAPNGMMYVKPEMRKSLLAKMLTEILETRVMVKSGMKADVDDATLQQLLNNRQLALKLLANVTYGYTSASFSGRMPCAEIADSIVQTARETLEKAIALIHSRKEWGAEVVYGDTDSLFVYLKGRTKDEAFDLGNEIAKVITSTNPRPIKLKFEKVYFPCVLLAKKRYVGFKYESKDQVEPTFDAKGIETVRRDGTPAEQKIEETALKLLFRSADLSQVKSYFQRQCAKIMQGKVSIQDFCFAREVKLGHYSDKGPPPPGALISTRKMLEDPRTEPQYGERVPYVVATGAPGARLIDRCIAPEKLLKEGGELDAEYYISKNLIPPLERIFNLVGANVRQWFDEMPKIQRIRDLPLHVATESGALIPMRKTMESYMKSSHCLICRTKLPPQQPPEDGAIVLPICEKCQDDPSSTLYKLRMRLRAAQKKAAQLETICRSCSGLPFSEEVKCDSKDCPVYYSRVKARAKEQKLAVLIDGVGGHIEELEW